MTSYLVEWRIDMEADSPDQAAAMALAVMLDPESTALHFTVVDPDHQAHAVDLYPL